MIRRNLVTGLLGHLGLAGLARKALVRGGRFALNFHGVSRQRYPTVGKDFQPHHSTAEFRQVLSWLAPRFAFLNVDQFINGSEPGVLLTFDDGHANNLTNILPVLTEYQAQGLFFVTTQHVMEPRNWLSFTSQDAQTFWGPDSDVPDDFAADCYDGLSERQLAEFALSPWAVIGSHTITHPSLLVCSNEQLKYELSQSRIYLQNVSGQQVDYFAYPYGNYTRHIAETVNTTGYKAAFAVDSYGLGLPSFEIPRVGIYASDPSYLSVKLSGLHRKALHGPAISWKV